MGPQATSRPLKLGFDINKEDPGRLCESPGYEGWLRLQGSLLWDDLGALTIMETESLMELWPLAEDDSQKAYRHPLGRAFG